MDDLVRSLKLPIFVIPAKAGMTFFQVVTTSLESGFQRSDDFLRNHRSETFYEILFLDL